MKRIALPELNPAKIKLKRKRKILQDYRRNCPLEEISIRYHISPASISLLAKGAGLRRRRQGCRKKTWPDKIDIAIVEAVNKVVAGKPTLAEIGACWRMSRANVHRIYHRWKDWKPVNPFETGDKIRFMKCDFEVVTPGPFEGLVRNLKTGEESVIPWRADGRVAVKL